MNAPLNPALLAPAAQLYAVKITFGAGLNFKVNVRTVSEEQAKLMALIDARMSHFDEPMVSISTDRPP